MWTNIFGSMEYLNMSSYKSRATFKIVLLIGIFVAATTEGANSTVDNAYKTFSQKTTDADKRARPYHEEKPLPVTLQLFIVAFGPVNEKEFTFEADFFLRQWWEDPRLAIGGNVTLRINANPFEFMWVPDIHFTNARSTNTHSLLSPTTQIEVKPNGEVFVTSRVTGEFACNMDLQYYPMDTQKCMMVIESYGYSENDMVLEWRSPSGVETMRNGLKLPSYQVVNMETINSQSIYIGQNYTRLEVLYTVERAFIYYLYQIYLPSACLVCLSWGSLWLPADAVPARVTLIVTTFLATVFILQGASTEITKVDYITALEVFLCINFVFIFMMMLEYLLVINRKKKDDDRAKFLRGANNNESMTSKKTKQHLYVDKIGKIVFPVGYLFVLSIYFIFCALKTGIFTEDSQLDPKFA